jgi:hypothetical protein
VASQLVGGRKRLATVVTDMVGQRYVTSLRGSPVMGYKLSTPSSTPASSWGYNGAIRLARGTLNQS